MVRGTDLYRMREKVRVVLLRAEVRAKVTHVVKAHERKINE